MERDPFISQEAVPSGWLDARGYGAKGDGVTDNTAAVQHALDTARKGGGGTVYLPPGRYLFRGSLKVPISVTLAGSFHAPPAHNGMRDAGLPKPGEDGTTLMVTGGVGSEEGEPFLTLDTNSTLKGVTIFYSEQDPQARPKPYPWTIAMRGKNPAVLDVELLNPYNGIDATQNERHLIRNVHGQPLRRGILVDQIYDIGRIENVHWNPWWSMSEPVLKLIKEEGEAFILGKTDWEYMLNCFGIFYAIGFRFTRFKHGPGNTVLTQCGHDIGPVAVLVEDVQSHAGVAFTNGQFMANIVVRESNSGPVKFHNCGFWPIETTTTQADLAGRGHITFNGCHFAGWDRKNEGVPCIRARCNGLTVAACDFMVAGKTQVEIGAQVKAAILMGNRLRGGEKIINRSAGAQIGLNAVV